MTKTCQSCSLPSQANFNGFSFCWAHMKAHFKAQAATRKVVTKTGTLNFPSGPVPYSYKVVA